MASAQHFFFIIFKVIDEASRGIKNINTNVKKISKNTTRLNQVMNTFNMQSLGMMFTGMAITRVFSGMFRTLFEGYRKVENRSSAFLNSTDHLRASWEFLKFNIMSALENPAIINFVFNLVKIVQSMAQWTSEHPKIARFFLIIGGLAFGLGILLTIVGQVFLGWGVLFGTTGNVYLDIKSTFYLMKSNLLWIRYTGLPAVANAFKATFAWILANPIALFAVVIIGTMLLLSKKFGGFGEVAKSVLRAILRVGAIVADGLGSIFASVWNIILLGLLFIIDKVNMLIRKMNSAFGTSFGIIKTQGISNAFSDYKSGDIMEKYFKYEQDSFLTPKLGYTQDNLMEFYMNGGLASQYNEIQDYSASTTVEMEKQNELSREQNQLLIDRQNILTETAERFGFEQITDFSNI